MKNLILPLLLLIFSSHIGFGQKPPCTNFNNQNLSGWSMHNNANGNVTVSIANLNTNSSGPLGSGDFALNVTDQSGATWIYNSTNFAGNYTDFLGRCLCFDFQLTTNQQGAFVMPSIFLANSFNPNQPIVYGTNPTLIAKFTSSITVTQNSNWVHICAPIDLCSNGSLPSNSDGSWSMVVGNCNDWQTLLGSVTNLMFLVDMSGWGGQEIFNIDNVCIGDCPINNEGQYCCEGKNLISNGNFENGFSAFASQYNYQATLTPNSISPGRFSIVNFAQANTVANNWVVQDHTFCINSTNSNFLVINGQTQQSANLNNVIWQTIQPVQVQRDSQYRFCAYVNHLPQCSFDIVPKIQIEIKYAGSSTWTPILTWTPITYTGTNLPPCDWEEIGAFFTANTASVDIRILIDELGNGDGNDLAIDDISLTKKNKVPAAYANFNVTYSGNGNPYNVAAQSVIPSAPYNVYWIVGEMDATFTSFIANTMIVNSQSNPSWGADNTNFPGHFCNNFSFPLCIGGSSAGPFSINKKYGILRVVVDDCHTPAAMLIPIEKRPLSLTKNKEKSQIKPTKYEVTGLSKQEVEGLLSNKTVSIDLKGKLLEIK